MPPKKVKRSAGSSDVKGCSTVPVDSKEQRKSGGKTSRGKGRGGLKYMIHMPTDIIYEITRRLFPQDLLALSWSSKSFHVFLMKRSSARIWKESLKGAKSLPPCPDQLIEPAWISLLFSTYCTGCGSSDASETTWEFYARFCDSCQNTMLIEVSYCYDSLSPEQLKIYRDIPPLIFNQSHVTKPRKRDVYLRSQVMEFIDTWDKLTKAKEREKLAMFIGTQVLQVREIAEHAALCARWANRQVALRESERARLKSERLQEILRRLQELGWGPELSFLSRKEGYTPLLQHKQVKVPKKLTDRVWQNMREDLIKIVQGVRDAHPDLAFTEMLYGRTKVLEGALKELVRCPEVQAEGLKAVDLALMPEIRHIMCAPAEVKVNKESFMALQDQLGGMVERWKLRTCNELRGRLTRTELSDSGEYSAPWDPSNGVDPLELATTMFRCTGTHCNGYHDRMVFYPNVLRHACIRHSRPNLPKSDVYGNFILDEITWWRLSPTQIGIRGHYPLWNDGRLSAQKPTEKALTIIKLCGKDPRRVTAKEMEALELRLVGDEGVVMTWRAAMICQYGRAPRQDWRIASPEEVAQAKKYEAQLFERQTWICMICPPEAAPLNSLTLALSHLDSKHNVKDASPQCEHIRLEPDGLVASGVFKVYLKYGRAG